MNIWIKILSYVFFALVFAQTLFAAIRFGWWWGMIVLCIGLVFGFIYGEIRKNERV